MNPHPIGNGTLTPNVPRWFAALMDSFQLRGGNTDALMSISDADWEQLLDFSDPAHLTLALAQRSTEGFPQWVVERLTRNVADNHARFIRVRNTYEEAAKALDSAGVKYVVLKGFAQSPAYVADPRFRMQSDIDFFCAEDQINDAQRALERIGYARHGKEDPYGNADHVPSLKRDTNWKWQGNAFDPEMPLSIELHFCLWNERVSMLSVPEVNDFWRRREFHCIEGMAFPTLDPVDYLGYLALHVLRGALCGDWIIHHVLELAYFLDCHSRDDRFWSEWSIRCGPRFQRMQAISFALAERWFSSAMHPVAHIEVDELSPPVSAWLARCGGSLLEVMFGYSRDWVWLHVALLSSRKHQMAVLRRAIIPPRISKFQDIPVLIGRRRASRFSNRYLRFISFVVSRGALRALLVPRLAWLGAVLWNSPKASQKVGTHPTLK